MHFVREIRRVVFLLLGYMLSTLKPVWLEMPNVCKRVGHNPRSGASWLFGGEERRLKWALWGSVLISLLMYFCPTDGSPLTTPGMRGCIAIGTSYYLILMAIFTGPH